MPLPPAQGDPARRGYLLLGALTGYGFSEDARYGGNYLAAGIGGRVSYTFAAPVRVSVGAEAVYHFGFSRTSSLGFTTTRGLRGVYVGGTVGWDAIVGPLIVRPYLLAGALVTTRECSGCYLTQPEEVDAAGVFGGGLSLMLAASFVYFSADARVAEVFGYGAAATLYGGLGLRVR